MTDTDSKWIEFKEVLSKGTTKTFQILAKENGAILGQIKWYGAWRKYCFWPSPGSITVFETQCLGDIINFINKLMFVWKAEQQQKKQSKL